MTESPALRALPVIQLRGDRLATPERADFFGLLARSAALVVRGLCAPEACARWARAVYQARRRWVSDFGGEQFSLGRAFYTHFETDRSGLYFEDAARSDALVEEVLPGAQSLLQRTLEALVGGSVRPRLGFCGPGAHIFPARGKVAREGGVIHFDVEGLTPHQLVQRRPAVSLVVMLQAPVRGGGLRVWDSVYRGSEHPSDEDLAAPRRTVRYRAGDAVLIDSLRLHQIRPFQGELDRISLTAHAALVDRGAWDCWF